MKKNINKLVLKTDKIIALTKNQAQSMKGGRPPRPLPPTTEETECSCD